MALLYSDRASVQYVLAEEAARRPELQALFYLRDGLPEPARAIVEKLDPDRYFEYWLAALRQCPELLDRLGPRRPGLKGALRHLRAAVLARYLKLPFAAFREPMIAASQTETRPATSQFHDWGPLLVGSYDLKWECERLWQSVNALAARLPAANQVYFQQIYGSLAARVGRGGDPSGAAAHLRSYRHAYRAETRPPVADVLHVYEE